MESAQVFQFEEICDFFNFSKILQKSQTYLKEPPPSPLTLEFSNFIKFFDFSNF